MATVDGPKYAGPFSIDFSDVKDDLVDLPPGAMKGIRAEQDGIDAVVAELAKAAPESFDAADVPPQAYQRFVKRTAGLVRLRQLEIELAKAQEVIRETRAKMENDREDDVSVIAQAAQKAADKKKNAGIAAPFEQTIRYNSQTADKAAATRKKNAEAKGGGGQTPPPAGGGQGPTG